MPSQLYGALGVVLVAIVSGVVSLLIARRSKSGKIDTSEAAKLWDEGTSMRLELRSEVASLRVQLADAVEAITALNAEIRQARAEAEAARGETRKLMTQIDEIHNEIRTTGRATIGTSTQNAETRRIAAIPESDRSPSENKHMLGAVERLSETLKPGPPNNDEGNK